MLKRNKVNLDPQVSFKADYVDGYRLVILVSGTAEVNGDDMKQGDPYIMKAGDCLQINATSEASLSVGVEE